MINKLRAHYSVGELCEVLELPRSSYYYGEKRQGRVDPMRERLKAKVVALHAASRGTAGSRTLSAALRAEGEAIGRYKARHLMREAGIVSRQRRPHRYRVAAQASRIAPNRLNRAFRVARPDAVWCGDVTYIWTGSGWLYLAVVLDLYARRVVGWAMSRSPDSELTKQALAVAYEARGCPEGGLRIPLKMTADSEERDRLAHRFLTGAGFLLRAVTIGQLGGQFAHRFPAQFEAVRTVQQSVEDGVRQGRLADVVVPVLGG